MTEQTKGPGSTAARGAARGGDGRKTAAKRGFHHGDLPGALVAAASGLVAARGHAEFSLREVAESVGVSHTAAYRHFAAKSDLLAEIATRGFQRLEKAVAAATVRVAGAIDAPAALERAGLAYIDFAERHPGAYRVMFLPALCDKDRHPDLAQAATAAFDRLAEIVAAGHAAGVLRADIATAQLASAIWAAEHGHAVLLLDGQIRDGTTAITAPPADRRALIAMILRGVGVADR